MSEPRNGNGVWVRILAAVIPLAVMALIGWGALRSDVVHNAAALEKKADRETVDVQYQSIIRELQRINEALERLQR